MSGKTHQAIGVASACAVATFVLKEQIDLKVYLLIIFSSTLGALLPDIDHAGSKLGNKFPWISKILKHRGFTHTVWACLICFVLFNMLFIKYLNLTYSLGSIKISFYSVMFAAGYISHLVADCLTPAKLKPFKIGYNILNYRIGFGIVNNKLIEDIILKICVILIPFLIV